MQMNNEPVAWIGKNELQFGFTETTVTSEKESWDDIPLYLHPAKTLTDDPLVNFKPIWQEKPELTLTDEEIWKLWQKHLSDDIPVFARAVIKEANEK